MPSWTKSTKDTTPGETVQRIVTLLRAGGKARQAGVTALYERYARDFKTYFRRHGTTDAQAEDLLQEVFVKIIRSIDGWSGAGTIEAWIWAIARTTLQSDFRGPAEERGMVALDAQEPAVAQGMLDRAGGSGDPADHDCVSRGLDAFSGKYVEQAHVLERVALDGWGDEDVAAFRACGLGAAREYLSQCRKKLWPFIAHCYEH